MSEYLKLYRKNKLDEQLCKYKLKKMTFLINKSLLFTFLYIAERLNLDP